MRTPRFAPLLAATLFLAPMVRGQDPDYVIHAGFASGVTGSEQEVPIFMDNLGGGLTGFEFSVCNLPGELTPSWVEPGATLSPLTVDFFSAALGPNQFTVSMLLGGGSAPVPVGSDLEIVRASYLVTGSVGSLLCGCPGEPAPAVTAFGSSVEPVQECGEFRSGPFDATGTAVIFAGESFGGAVNSVEALRQALEANSVEVRVVTELSTGLFSNPQSLWIVNGTYPENHVLTAAEGQFIVDRILDGVPVYLESSDAWGFDAPTPFSDYDGVDGASVVDGDDSFQGMVGSTYLTANFGGLAAGYRQDNPVGNDYTDRLAPSTTDAAGPQAGVVWSDDGSGGASVAYATGIFYRTSGAAGNVLVQSWEFGGYEGLQSALADRYLHALGLGDNAFGRGDANADGDIDISDGLVLLNLFFVPGSPSLICADAGDCNDDGALNIADVVYLLNFLFVSGPPLPAPGCGIDPTPDSLDCLSWTPCLI